MNREVFVKENETMELIALYRYSHNGVLVRLFRHIKIDHNSVLSFYYSAFEAFTPIRVFLSFNEVLFFHNVLVNTGSHTLEYLERTFYLEIVDFQG